MYAVAYHNASTVNANVYTAVIMARPLQEFTWFIRWMQTQRQAATNPQTNPTDLGCESTTICTHRHHLLLLLSLMADTHFTIPQRVEGWVDLGGWSQTDMVYPIVDGHPSKY